MIPVSRPYISDSMRTYVNDCITSTWISSKGAYIERFERAFADYVGSKYAVAVNNGTAACHLALLSSGDFTGKNIAVPALTFIATVNAVKYVDAHPIFVDVNKNTWNIDINDLERKIDQCQAVFAVHLLGVPCFLYSLRKLCREHNCVLIEDACEALGMVYNGIHVGNFGKAAAWSFFANKLITTGEGGMLTTNDKEVRDKAVLYRGQGQTQQYYHEVVGYNYRMTNIQAAIGLSQIDTVEDIIYKRQKICDEYTKLLKPNPRIQLQRMPLLANSNLKWMFAAKFMDTDTTQKIVKALTYNRVETRPMFKPIHKMPMYDTGLSLPVAEHIAETTIMLPTFTDLSLDAVNFICTTINDNA